MSPSELAERFLTVWQAAGRPPIDRDQLGAALARTLANASDLIDHGELVEALTMLAPADPHEVFAFLATCRIEELALALSAAKGSSEAVREIERRCAGVLAAVTARYAGEHTREDLRQLIAEKLFVSAGEPATITRYDGRGSLPHWVRVIAVRLCIDLHRRKDRQRERPAALDDAGLALVGAADLMGDRVKGEYRTAVVAALRAAVRELSPGDRQLLRQHFVHRLTIDQLAAARHIHRSTAARRIATVREAVAASARTHLSAQLQLEEHELEDVVGLIASRLELSLPTLLASRELP